jgi:ATP-binding protein involved in chromosome partitioning
VGYKVGLLDCNIHDPTISTIFGLESERLAVNEKGILPIKVRPNLSMMPVGFLLENKDPSSSGKDLQKWGLSKSSWMMLAGEDLDFLIIDLPPGTGDESLSIAQLVPNYDGSVLVTTPQDVALISVRKSIRFSEKLKVPIIGLVDNMPGLIRPHCVKSI